jgi:glycosyltransferase involved in cell wall biosynthesis
MIKVALFYKNLDRIGGAERLVIQEALYLSRYLGYSVPIICYSASNIVKEYLFDSNVKFVLFGNIFKRLLSSLYLWKNNYSHLLCSSGHFDCFLISRLSGIKYSLHVHHPLMMSPTDTVKYAFRFRHYYRKALLLSHERRFLEETRSRLTFLDHILVNIRASFYSHILKRASNIFVLSERSKTEKVEMLGLNRVAACAGAFSESDIDIAKHIRSYSRNHVKVLCVGRLVWDKRFDIVIESCKMASMRLGIQFKLDIVGDGPHRHYLETRLGPNMVVHGSLPDTEMNSLWKDCDIFCTPDWADFKITMFESLSKGIHTIVTRETDVIASLEASGYLHYCNPDVHSLAQSLVDIVTSSRQNNPDLLVKCLHNYTWETYFRQILSVISKSHA